MTNGEKTSKQQRAWYAMDAGEVLDRLDSDGENGLNDQTAADRLAEHGKNELEDKGTRSAWMILFEQFAQTMVVILIIAAVISAFLGDWLEAGAIMAIVILFATLGFFQDYRADRAMAALKEMSVPEVRAVRDGRKREIPSVDLVPGDIVLLEAGNVVPADLRLLEVNDLQVDESALTGESEPVYKQSGPIDETDLSPGDRLNMAFSGTVVNAGRGRGVVVETGMSTEMGNIATMIQDKEEGKTPMQRELSHVGKLLAIGGILVSIVVALVGYFILDQPLKQMFLVAVSLAVAVVPEGLPAVVTLTLSLGSQRMLKRHALIRKLPAVETLGSVTVICTDKTGTLTQNRMTVTDLRVPGREADLSELPEQASVDLEGHDPDRIGDRPDRMVLLLAGGVLCNDASLRRDEESDRIETVGDPTEGALLAAAVRTGLSWGRLAEQFPRRAEVSFDSDRKRMTTFHLYPDEDAEIPQALQDLWSGEKKVIAVTKGAVDGLLEITERVWTDEGINPLDNAIRKGIDDDNQAMTRQGMRVLALGVRFLDEVPETVDGSQEKDLTFVGLFGMIDPPRPEVAEAVEKCKTAGIRPVMITGDHPVTALNIAQDLGITENENVIDGKELTRMSDEKLTDAVREASVFARVSPEHKLRIVDAFQGNDEICSMTGDGVNDAPALKKADIGVAMGITGTDVSKEAADMVLLDDNYATIVAAVEEGRVIGDNVRRFVKYSIAGNIGKVLVMMAAPLFGITLALKPLQLLWLNLITDGLLGLGMSVEPPDKNTMNREPRTPDEGVFSHGGVQQVFVVGFVIGAVALGVGAWYHNQGAAHWQTMIFTLIAFLQVGQALAMRSDKESLFSLGLLTNKLLLYLSVGIIAIQIGILYIPQLKGIMKIEPLTPAEIGICALFGTTVFIVLEVWKIFRRRG